MRKIFLRTLVVAGTVWVVACMDNSTQPTDPQFGHIPNQSAEFDALEAQIVELFPDRQENGAGGDVERAALEILRNLARSLSRELPSATGQAVTLSKLAGGLLNTGTLFEGPYTTFFTDPQNSFDATTELMDELTALLAGNFAASTVTGGQAAYLKTPSGFASLILEAGDTGIGDNHVEILYEIFEADCLGDIDLEVANGCWRADRSEGPGLLPGETAEFTVCADFGPGDYTLHKLTDGIVQALEVTGGDLTVDCTGYSPSEMASVESNSFLNFASAVSDRFRALLGPQPLHASTAATAFAPTRLGGLGGSYSNLTGAISEFEIEQNGVTQVVAPLKGTVDVSTFYDYGSLANPSGASANTGLERNDESILFLYEDNLGATSLVMIHDNASPSGDGTSGQTSFDFTGVPTSNSFVVRDDNGDGLPAGALSAAFLASWNWNEWNTDGGAVSGGLESDFEITIDPTFTAGITDWVFLNGTGVLLSPADIPLTLSDMITISRTTP